MKRVTIKDGSGKLIEVMVTDEVYDELERVKRVDRTKQRIDRARLVKDELSDYHFNILMNPPRLMSEEVEERLLIHQMLEVIGTLSDYERLLIHKRFYEKATFTEMAKESGVTYQAIQQRVNRVVRKLAQAINP